MLRLKAALGVGKSTSRASSDSPAVAWLDTANRSLAQQVEVLSRQCELWEAECAALEASHAHEMAVAADNAESLQRALCEEREMLKRISGGTSVGVIVSELKARCATAEAQLVDARSQAAEFATALAERDRADATPVAAARDSSVSPSPSSVSSQHMAALEAARMGLEQLVEDQGLQLDRLTGELAATLRRHALDAQEMTDKADIAQRRIAQLEAELADKGRTESKEKCHAGGSADSARALEIRVEVLQEALDAERRANDKAEAARAVIETQLRDVKMQLEDAEERIRGRGSSSAATFQVTLQDMESNLEEEAERCEDAMRTARRLEKRCRELASSVDEKERLLTEQRLLTDKMSSKVDVLKQKLSLHEEALERSNQSKRKIARDFDEQTEKLVSLETEIRQLRGKVRRQVRAAQNADDSD